MPAEAPPKAIVWYRAYCWAAAVSNFLLFVGGLWLASASDALANDFFPAYTIQMAGWMFGLMGLAFAILNTMLPFFPRRKSYWLAHFINIILGLGSVCLTPFCLWLMFLWIQPEVKDWFNE